MKMRILNSCKHICRNIYSDTIEKEREIESEREREGGPEHSFRPKYVYLLSLEGNTLNTH